MTLLPLKCCELRNVLQLFSSSVVFTLGLAFESFKEFGVCQDI